MDRFAAPGNFRARAQSKAVQVPCTILAGQPC